MRSSEPESNCRAAAQAGLSETLGHEFRDSSLLERALTHPSVATRHPSDHYERLEFLGDRVLGLVVADLLWHRYPQEAEGALARRHANAVCRDALAEVAQAVGLDAAMRLAKGEDEAGERNNPAIMSNVCEAVIAALYLDGGLEAARQFVERNWLPQIEANRMPPRDPKTSLQEWAQGRGLPLPEYREVNRSGPAHEPVFTIEVSVEGLAPAQAEGRSKRVAERSAAEKLLAAIAEPQA